MDLGHALLRAVGVVGVVAVDEGDDVGVLFQVVDQDPVEVATLGLQASAFARISMTVRWGLSAQERRRRWPEGAVGVVLSVRGCGRCAAVGAA
jgi:hypothetical protein